MNENINKIRDGLLVVSDDDKSLRKRVIAQKAIINRITELEKRLQRLESIVQNDTTIKKEQ